MPFSHELGLAGSALILFAWLGYSWRKQEGRGGPGSMEAWLVLHVVAGALGTGLVLLHGAFVLRGLAGMALLLALIVTASGVVGRFVYTAAPRGRDGAGGATRRSLALWWLLHVPLAAAMVALALVHVAGVLWYGTR